MEGEPEPYTGISRIIGLLKILQEKGGSSDLYQLGIDLHLELGEELQIVRSAESLGFVDTPESDISLTPMGEEILRKDINGRKALIRERLLTIPIFIRAMEWLGKAAEESLSEETVKSLIGEQFPNEDVDSAFAMLVNWGRYAELLGYSAAREELYIDRGS
ncbi:MAG: AAA-associated domain-containing protein [Nitrospirota bacterium]|nr:AAA-associated domain-containing protein [Nitrospirota bacterium]